MSRYYVDERGGCIAVRDRERTDPATKGLHADTAGVVRYWHGTQVYHVCPTCGHRRMEGWQVADTDRDAAIALCAEMNARAEGGRR